MNEYTISDLITAYYEREFDVPDHNIKPTFRHRRRMKRIFEIFAENKRKMSGNTRKSFAEAVKNDTEHKLKPRQKIIIVIAIIIVSVFLVGFIVKFVSDSFHGTVYDDNTNLFAIDTSNCPETIEEHFFLSVVPDGYEINEIVSDPYCHSVTYIDKQTEQTILFRQWAKKEFDARLNTEKYELIEIKISSCNGLYLDTGDETYSDLIWDSEKYVFMLSGNIDKNQAIYLAETNEKQGFLKNI